MTRRTKSYEVFNGIVRATRIFTETVNMMNNIRRVFAALLASVCVPCKRKFSGSAKFIVLMRSLRPSLYLVRVFFGVFTRFRFTLNVLTTVAKLFNPASENKLSATGRTVDYRANRNYAARQPERFQAFNIILLAGNRFAGFTVRLCGACWQVIDSASGAGLGKKPDACSAMSFHGAWLASFRTSRPAMKVRSAVNAICRSVILHGINPSQNISEYTILRGRYV